MLYIGQSSSAVLHQIVRDEFSISKKAMETLNLDSQYRVLAYCHGGCEYVKAVDIPLSVFEGIVISQRLQ